MREITTHRVDGLNEALTLHAMDEPGAGGACHHYRVQMQRGASAFFANWHVQFQEGFLHASGVNGVSNEVLLAIVRDRLEGFQSGNNACQENADALECVKMAMDWLLSRTMDRVQRGVEDTPQV
jgi:hypothetical protein